MSAEPCPRCGELLPPKANFCPNCGAPVVVPAASERRVVTVVFVDLAGSTGSPRNSIPSATARSWPRSTGWSSEEVSWLGGVAEGFIGDAVLGVFGVKAARTDDAVRAYRAALDIRTRAERLGRELGLSRPMQVRIGVEHRRRGGRHRDRPQHRDRGGGERRRSASAAAAPGEIVAGATTVLLARDAVEFGELRELAAKGFEGPLSARPVLELRERPRVDRARIPFVNRRRSSGCSSTRSTGRRRVSAHTW